MTTCAQAIQEVFKSKDQILTTKQIINAVEIMLSIERKLQEYLSRDLSQLKPGP